MSPGWPLVKLGAVVQPVSRPVVVDPTRQYHLLGAHWYAKGLYEKDVCAGSAIAASKLYRVEAGDFIYNRLFAWKGSFAVANKGNHNCFVSGEFPCFEVDPARLDASFLWRYFSREVVWNEALGLSSGGTPFSRNRLKEERFLAMAIPLPPLEEQRRIVAKLDALAAGLGQASNISRRASSETDSLFLRLMAGLFPEPSKQTVGEWVRFQTGYAFKSEWFAETGIRLARNANIGHGTLDWSEAVRLPSHRRSEFAPFELVEGDILISLDRPIISTGVKVARVRQQDLPCLLLQRVARAQFVDGSLLPDYFFGWLRSTHFSDAIDPGRSNGVPHISHKDIEAIPFTVPPLAEQLGIVVQQAALQQRAAEAMQLHHCTLAELDAFMPSLLDRAFRGEL